MNIAYVRKLFGRSKRGEIKVWDISVGACKDYAVIVIGHRTGLDGKEVVHRKEITEGKNLGRANATTPLEQALSEAESRYKLQLDKGYKTEIPPEGEITNALGYPMPMLATPLEKIKQDLSDVEFLIQPKLDGFRCLALKDEDGEVHLYTRRGKRIETLPHLEEHYRQALEPGDHVDGELYLHGEPLQKIASYVKRQQEGSERIEHHLYDVVSGEPYAERFKRLNDIVDGPVRRVATTIGDLTKAQELFAMYRRTGFEGAMLRHPDSPYEIGVRSKFLIKMKGFEEEDFRIIDIVQGQPKFKPNGDRLEVAVLVCETPEGKTFNVTAPGTELDKHTTWQERKAVIGGYVEVKFANKVAKTGIPFHPVAVKIKDKELD